MSACRSNLTPGCSANGLNRVFVLRGFEFGTSPFPFRIEAVDKVLVVVHLLRDGSDGVAVGDFVKFTAGAWIRPLRAYIMNDPVDDSEGKSLARRWGPCLHNHRECLGGSR